MKSFKLVGIGILIILMGLTLPGGAWGKEDDSASSRTIRVQGEGKVWAVPDQAEIEIEVQEEGKDIDEMSQSVQGKMETLFKAVLAFGISKKDIQTTSYSVQPKMRYTKGEMQKDGFTLSHKIKVVLKNVDLAGKVLKAVLKDGATQVEGPIFNFSDPAKLKIEALTAAVADAYAKAKAMAQTAGVALGPVDSISQLGLTMPIRPVGRMMAAAMPTGDEVTVATGENEVTASVEVIYSLQ